MDELLKKFKDEIFTLIDRGVVGSTRFVPTAEQINAIMLAETYMDAKEAALSYGWNDYVSMFEARNETDISPEDEMIMQLTNELQDLKAFDNPFIGVEGDSKIMYQGVETTIADYGDNFYKNNDNDFEFLNSTPEQIMELQADLVNAGLLGPKVGKPFRPGVWQPELEGAIMYSLMSQANAIGIGKKENGWQNVLESYIQNPVAMGLQVDPYLPPDYDSIATSVNNLFKQQLGRDPMPYELRLLANTYMSETEKAYNQKVMLLEEANNMVATPDNLMEYGNHIQKKIIEEQGLTEIDPGAGMFAKFQQITAEEQERLKDYGDIQKTNSLILNSITGAPR